MKGVKKVSKDPRRSLFNLKLRALRKSKGWSIRDFAKLVGMSNGYIATLETNHKITLPDIKMVRFAKVLDVPVEFLKNSVSTELKDSDIDKFFYEKYKKLPKKDKELMRKIIKCFDK
ncbi:MAG: helix-turn-helix domain-containing protein [Lactococcus lactis]